MHFFQKVKPFVLPSFFRTFVFRNEKNTLLFQVEKMIASKLQAAREKIIKVLKANSDTAIGESKEVLFEVDNATARKIGMLLGKDVFEYKHTVDKSGVNHAILNHGQRWEDNRGQKQLTEEDFLRIPDVIAHYDSIEIPLKSNGKTAKSGNGNDIILFKKQYADGKIYYVEEVRTGKKELAMATLWVVNKREPEDSLNVGNEKMHGVSAPSALTSKTLSHNKSNAFFSKSQEK